MRKLNYARILLLLLLVLGLGACGDEYYTDDYLKNSDGKLCDKYWTETYKSANGKEFCTHSLFFSPNYKGKEIFKYQRINEDGSLSGIYREASDVFEWRWIDDMEGLALDYIDTNAVFENV